MGCGSSEPQTKTEHTNQNSAQDKNVYYNNNNDNKSNENRGRTRTAGRRDESRYYTNSQKGSENGDVNKQPNDTGYKKRIRSNLNVVTRGSNIEEIEKAKEKFENNRLEDCGDLTRTNKKLELLYLKRDLRDAVRRSHVGTLERTLDEANNSPYVGQVGSQIEAAEKKLAHLRELNQYSHDILDMDQQTISEIHSYHRPPKCVHDVMAASYMLLGHKESELKDWSYLQSMAGRVGRDSLIHQVRAFDSGNVSQTTAHRVKEILNYHLLSEVRVASNGAAAFYVWADNVVDKIDKDDNVEEQSTTREEEERQRQDLESKSPPGKSNKERKR